MTTPIPDKGVPTGVLRPALEAAVEVAQAAVAATPPLTPPRQLRPFLGLRRLPDRGLGPVRRALEDDEAFRRLVAAATTEELVGRMSWLWLQRPDGWEEELVGLANAEQAGEAAAQEARAAGAKVRRLGAVEEALRKAEGDLATLRDDLARAREQLTEERRARHNADSETGRLRRRVAEIEADHDTRGQLITERDRLAAEVARLTGLLEARPEARAGGLARRRPVLLPPAIFDDTVEAAEHLVRVVGVLVLIDGYNVTKRNRDDLSIAAQRQWLLDAVGGLAARCGAEVHVVFDGAQGRTTAPALGPRRTNVLVRYTAEGLEADDELLAMVAATPVGRPVVVVSSDGRVAAGAAELGANVIGADTFADLLRR